MRYASSKHIYDQWTGFNRRAAIHAPPPINSCKNTTAKTIQAAVSKVSDGQLTERLGSIAADTQFALIGDLNSLPWSSQISEIETRGLVDSYRDSRYAIGGTWSPNSWLPFLARIDYIFTPKDAEVLASGALDILGSDHRAVFTDFSFRRY